MEPVGLHQVGPDHAQHFPFTPHQPVRAVENGLPGLLGYPRRGVRRQDGGKPALARAARGAAERSARASPAVATKRIWSTWSRTRHATSAGDILRQPCARTSQAVTSRSRSYPLRSARSTGSRARRWSPWSRPPGTRAGSASRAPARLACDELRELGSLALVLAAARPRGALPPSGPDRGLPEVVKPRAAAASRGVERLLRDSASCRP